MRINLRCLKTQGTIPPSLVQIGSTVEVNKDVDRWADKPMNASFICIYVVNGDGAHQPYGEHYAFLLAAKIPELLPPSSYLMIMRNILAINN